MGDIMSLILIWVGILAVGILGFGILLAMNSDF
jgi:hypothetical protein